MSLDLNRHLHLVFISLVWELKVKWKCALNIFFAKLWMVTFWGISDSIYDFKAFVLIEAIKQSFNGFNPL